jgi:nitroimidazol reductase NimA-like FMN-containing flavoprotein (pyridoxamine 5'-phosphate oxidase superfamily)
MRTDRLGVTILEANTCWELLRNAEVGRLAVSIGERPDIFPVNFVVDHGSMVFRTAEGTKLAAAVLGRAVAFEIDGYDADVGEALSVVVKGCATEVERMQDVYDALELPLFPWHAAPKHRFVRIEPEDVSGRRFTVVAGPLPSSTGLSAPAERASRFLPSK